MASTRALQQDMELSSLPHDGSDVNSSEFKSPNSSSFYYESGRSSLKASTPLLDEQENYSERIEATTEAESEQKRMQMNNNYCPIKVQNVQSDQNAGKTDWFGLPAPKFGTLIKNRIFVGGISSQTTEHELTHLFSTYGHIKATKIVFDRAGVSKGYGFVTFETEQESEALCNAIMRKEIPPIVLRERRLNVAPAVKKQVGFRSDLPYIVDQLPSPSPIFAGGYCQGLPGQFMYSNQLQQMHPQNQLQNQCYGQAQFCGVHQTHHNYPGCQVGGLPNQPVCFVPPTPQPYQNYQQPQFPVFLQQALPSFSLPSPTWFNSPTLQSQTQMPTNNTQNGLPSEPIAYPFTISNDATQLLGGFECFQTGIPRKENLRSYNVNSTTFFPRKADSMDRCAHPTSTSSIPNDTTGIGSSSDDSIPQIYTSNGTTYFGQTSPVLASVFCD